MRPDFLIAFDSETIPVETESPKGKVIVHKPILVSFVASPVKNFQANKPFARYFEDIEKFNKAIKDLIDAERTKQKKDRFFNVLIVAHNITFDDRATKLSIYLEQFYDLEFENYDNRFIKILVNRDRKVRIYFLDTMNFVRAKLSEIGEMLGIKKLEFDVEHIDVDRFKNDRKYRFALIKYNIVDSLIAFKFTAHLIEFFKSNFDLTMSSIALNVFKSENREVYSDVTLFSKALKYAEDPPFWLRKEIRLLAKDLVKHKDRIFKLLVDSYRGGRVEVFKRGTVEEPVVLDVNSMYPFVMRERTYPAKLLFYVVNDYEDPNDRKVATQTILKVLKNTQKMLKLQKKELLYIVRGTFSIKPIQINKHQKIAPVMVKRDGKLVPAVGIVNTVLTSAELNEFSSYIDIIEIDEVIAFEGENIFRAFVDKYYELKKNARTKAERTMAKLLLNSLYGKFGQREELKQTLSFNSLDELKEYLVKRFTENFANQLVAKLEEDNIVSVLDETAEQRITVYKFDENVYRVVIKFLHEYELSTHSNIAIASFVTAYARNHLTKLISKIGRVAEVYYCDTDSIHTHRSVINKIKNLIDDSELGKLKIEESADYGVYLTLKVYALLNVHVDKGTVEIVKIRAKGIPKRVIEEVYPEKELPIDLFVESDFEASTFVPANAVKDANRVINLVKIFKPLREINFVKFAGLKEGLNRFELYDNVLMTVHKEFSFAYDKAVSGASSYSVDASGVVLSSVFFEPVVLVDWGSFLFSVVLGG